MPPSGLSGTAAIITGAGSGIGRATALHFARQGAKVFLTGRDIASLDRVAREIQAQAGEAIPHGADLREEGVADQVVDAARAALGGVDVLVNNAGAPGEGVPAHECTDAVWSEILETNLTAAFRMTRAVLRVFLTQQRGVIVNVASTAAIVAMPGMTAYSASKAALVAMTRAVALDYAAAGVRCNCVLPGLTETPMTASSREQSKGLGVVRDIPVGRAASPEEIAAAIGYLSGEASAYVHGAQLVVDGGQSLAR